MTNAEPGWYEDTDDPTRQRRWDGESWTAERRPTPRHDEARPSGWALAGTGAAMVIGSMLPWYVVRLGFGQASFAGTEGDGVMTLIIGLLVAAGGGVVLTRGAGRKLAIGVLVAAAIAVLISGYHVLGQSLPQDVDSGSFSIGAGAWLTLLASLGASISAIVLIRRPQ